jgi:Raf kinase inhibitor-like YbhB/YbcL family protein
MKTIILLIMTFTFGKTITVKSTAFKNNEMIPAKYTCTDSNISPPLEIGDIPKGTQSLALIVDDPDAPNGTVVHWVMWNIPANGKLEENTAPGTQGVNIRKENKYTGPCPPSGTHHYHFKVYALDKKLELPVSADKEGLLKAMENHILAQGELIGLYHK